MSASEWRSGGYLQDSKNGKTSSKGDQPIGNKRQDFDVHTYYAQGITNLIWRVEMKNKEVIKQSIKAKGGGGWD